MAIKTLRKMGTDSQPGRPLIRPSPNAPSAVVLAAELVPKGGSVLGVSSTADEDDLHSRQLGTHELQEQSIGEGQRRGLP